MKFGFASTIVLCLSLAVGCAQDADTEGELSVADQARAAEMLSAYESASKEKNWEVAEAHADTLRAAAASLDSRAASADAGPSQLPLIPNS